MKVELIYDDDQWVVTTPEGKILYTGYDRMYGSSLPDDVEKAIKEGLGIKDD
jgi:hypothetical protein